MLTKEEYEKALYKLSLITANNTEDGSCDGCSCMSCLPSSECENAKLIEVFNNLIKDHYELVDGLFTKEEITCIANCLAVACFDNEKAKAIMSKLEKQKEWAKNNVD